MAVRKRKTPPRKSPGKSRRKAPAGPGLRRVLIAAAAGDAPALRRARALSEGLAEERCHPVLGLVTGAGGTRGPDHGLDWLHAEARSAQALGLVVVGLPASALGERLARDEAGSSLERLPRVLVLHPPFSAPDPGVPLYFGGVLCLGKPSALPRRPWLMRSSSDPSPDRRLLPTGARNARGKASRALLRLLRAARSRPQAPPAPAGSGAASPAGGPPLDLLPGGSGRVVALFPRERFPAESLVILRSSSGSEQRRLLASGSSLWFQAGPGEELQAEVRTLDGRLLARSRPLRVPGRPSRARPGTGGGIRGPSSW